MKQLQEENEQAKKNKSALEERINQMEKGHKEAIQRLQESF